MEQRDVPDRDDWFVEVHGFPRPQWPMVEEWIREHVLQNHDALDKAWQQFVRHWLERLARRLGAGYEVVESGHFQLLAQGTEKERAATLNFLERARRHISGVLGDICIPKQPGKQVVLSFADLDDYFHYVAAFGPDGEEASSGGMFLHDHYLHIAFPECGRIDEDRRTCAHELSHHLLAHLPLPLWLNEALAMAFEADIAGGTRELTREIAERHRSYWNADTIQGFWEGAAFSDVAGQEVAYSLARILLKVIYEDVGPSREDFRKFVARANLYDAGAAAARLQLGVELDELVSSFLGPGDWKPKPARWEQAERERRPGELE